MLPIAVWGQRDFLEKKYSLNGVVPENQVKDVLVDKNGFYWLTTPGGKLLRWDGNHFELFNLPDGGIGSRMLTGLNGEIYIMDGQMSYYYMDSTSQLRPVEIKGDIPVNPLFSFVGTNLSLAEIGKRNQGTVFDEFKRIFTDDKERTAAKIYYIESEVFYTVISHPEGLKERESSCIFYDHRKLSKLKLKGYWLENTWVIGNYLLTVNKGFYRIYFKDSLIKEGFDKTMKELIQASTPRGVIFNNVMRSLFIANKTGIYRIKWSNDQLLVEKYLDATGIENFDDFINFYCDEKREQVVATSISGGFSMFEKKNFTTRKLSTKSYENIVYSIAPKGRQLLTNQDFQRKVKPGSDDYGFISPIIVTPGGNIFYPGYPRALLMDGNLLIKRSWKLGKKQVKFAVQKENIVYLDSDIPRTFNLSNQEISEWKFEPTLDSSEKIWCLEKGPGNLLYAAIDSLLFSINTDNYHRKKLSLFSVIGIRSLYYDADINILFITISGKGIYILNLTDHKVSKLPVGGFQQLISCHYILKDKAGDYWLPTNSGLFLMTANMLKEYMDGKFRYIHYSRFGTDFGLINEEFNGGFSNGGIAIGDSIFLSSMSGIVSFNPETLKSKQRERGNGKILVSSVIVDDSLLNSPGKVKLPAGFKRCVFRVSFPYVNMPTAILEYQLNGSRDSGWTPLSQNSEVLLRELLPGNYNLVVRVKDHPEITPIEFRIVAEQYWYKTTVAYIFYTSLFMLLFFILASWRIHVIRNKSLREIDDSRKELLAIVSHDLRSPLTAYQGLADNISYLIKRKEYNRIENIAAQIDSTSAKIDLLMNNLLRWNTLQKQKSLTQDEPFSLDELVSELASLYKDIASFKKVEVKFNSGRSIIISSDKDLVSLIVRNLLDNAVKSSPPETCIHINLVKNPEYVLLSVRNMINENEGERVSRAADFLAEGENWEPGQQGMGFGLKMVKLAIGKIAANIIMEVKSDVVTTKILFK